MVSCVDLVYNSRKRGGDSADRYFKATEMIAGVKDMRVQALMPDVLHWLGIQKIDNMISMVSRSHRCMWDDANTSEVVGHETRCDC